MARTQHVEEPFTAVRRYEITSRIKLNVPCGSDTIIRYSITCEGHQAGAHLEQHCLPHPARTIQLETAPDRARPSVRWLVTGVNICGKDADPTDQLDGRFSTGELVQGPAR